MLVLCGTGVWFDELRQFLPPRSLEESLRSLLVLELIELVDPGEAWREIPPPAFREALPALRGFARP